MNDGKKTYPTDLTCTVRNVRMKDEMQTHRSQSDTGFREPLISGDGEPLETAAVVERHLDRGLAASLAGNLPPLNFWCEYLTDGIPCQRLWNHKGEHRG